MFKHSQYQISEATYVFDPKKLQKESRRERRKQYYILSRGLCLTKTTRNKGTGASFRGLWTRAGADWRSDTLTSLALRKGWFMKFLLSSKGDKTREKRGSPTKLALASNTADESLEDFPKNSVDPVVSVGVGNKWAEARLKGLQTT